MSAEHLPSWSDRLRGAADRLAELREKIKAARATLKLLKDERRWVRAELEDLAKSEER